MADVVVTGPAVGYFFLALVVPAGFLVRLIGRTSPRIHVQHRSRLETAVAPWLWTRRKHMSVTVLAAVTATGAIVCALTNFLPVITFTRPPLFPGDPFAGPLEHDPTARSLALGLGIVVALLALRRAAGGEGITVPVNLILATVLLFVAALALQDYLSNANAVPGRFAPVVSVGPGLFVLLIGSAVAWLGCVADLASGLSQALRSARRVAAAAPGE